MYSATLPFLSVKHTDLRQLFNSIDQRLDDVFR
jgi:hypothetical protein